MSAMEEYLVSGAELECPNGTITCKLKEGEHCATMQMRDRVFLSVRASKKGENLDGFGMCMSPKCTGGITPCMVRMATADEWMNPIVSSHIVSLQRNEEAIHREASLLCVSGHEYIKALTTGQIELAESEKKFYQYMSEMFGFDEDIIAIMLKVIYAIDEEYPNESERNKAWRFARLMGGFSYGFGADNKFIEIRNGLPDEAKRPVNYVSILWDIALWNATAGEYDTILSEKFYFIDKLHLSEYEYNKLHFHVMAQHEITSRPAGYFPQYMTEGIDIHIQPYHKVWKDYYNKFDAEGNFADEWERLYYEYINISDDLNKEMPNLWELFEPPGPVDSKVEEYINNSDNFSITPKYSDFSHQQILTAAITLDGITADKMAGNFVSTLCQSITDDGSLVGKGLAEWLSKESSDIVNSYRTSLAGWLGDLRLADNKMSVDDYKADLDGLNVSNLVIKEDINTIEAINEYYGVLESGATTREKEFLCNMGNGDASTGYSNIVLMDAAFGAPENAKSMLKQVWDDIKNGEKIEVSLDETVSEFFKKVAVGLE